MEKKLKTMSELAMEAEERADKMTMAFLDKMIQELDQKEKDRSSQAGTGTATTSHMGRNRN